MSQAQLTGFFSVQKRGHASAENPHPHKRDRQDMLTGLSGFACFLNACVSVSVSVPLSVPLSVSVSVSVCVCVSVCVSVPLSVPVFVSVSVSV